MVQHSLDPLRKALGSDPFEGNVAPTPEEADAVLAKPAARLARSLAKLLTFADSERGSTALPAEQWDELSRLPELFREYRHTIPTLEFRPSALRDASRKVIEACTRVQKGVLPREPVRQVERDAEALERIAVHIELYLARTAILQMDHQVFTMREFVTGGAREEEPRSVCQLPDLVGEATQRLVEFARNQGVEIEHREGCPRAMVKVAERAVVRALTSLLHNAIKYSWHPAPGRRRWVTVDCAVVGGHVQVTFQNYGVPIARDEIQQELIFQVGYRGRLSRDRGRMGTGIGLADARAVARDHGGDVTIASRPAHTDMEDDPYSVPFLTTATLILPLHRKEGRL
jgi:signal transduction histidine kinase